MSVAEERKKCTMCLGRSVPALLDDDAVETAIYKNLEALEDDRDTGSFSRLA